MDQSKKKILVIEDESALLYSVQSKLSSQGYKVYSASDGEGGRQKVKDFKPDLIILDILLPGKDGFEILGELKDNKEMAHIPVIIISRLDDVVSVAKGMKLGAKEYILKAKSRVDDIVEKAKRVLEEE